MWIACSTAVACNEGLEPALDRIAAIDIPTVDVLVIDGWAHVNTRDLVADYAATASRLTSALARRDLTIRAMNTGLSPQLHHRSSEVNEQRRREAEALVRLMNDLGVTIAAIQPRNADPKRPWEDVLADCVETLREQVEIGRRGGVQFALELHVHSPFETMEQARRLVEAYPDVPLVYDPTHFVMQGIPLRETRWLLERGRHVHLRDAAKGKIQVPFGQGDVDFDWVLGELQAIGYDGGISIEYLHAKEFDAPQSARRLYDKLVARTR